MKYVTYWYQFFTCWEDLVPIIQSVKFVKCEICGSTEPSLQVHVPISSEAPISRWLAYFFNKGKAKWRHVSVFSEDSDQSTTTFVDS